MNLLIKRSRMASLLLSTIFTASAWSAEVLTLTYQDSEFAAPLTEHMRWRPNDLMLKRCAALPAEQHAGCMQDDMKKQKLPTLALRFTELTSAYITNYHKTGPLTIIKTFIPAADHTVEFFIKNTQGKVINVNNGDVQKLLQSQPSLTQKYKLPKNFLVGKLTSDHLPPIVRSFDSWKTEFSFELREQCMACRMLGKISIAYRFNKAGEFKDLEIVEVRLKKDKS